VCVTSLLASPVLEELPVDLLGFLHQLHLLLEVLLIVWVILGPGPDVSGAVQPVSHEVLEVAISAVYMVHHEVRACEGLRWEI